MKNTIIWRHRKENLKKCTLQTLKGKEGFSFYTYPKDLLPDISGYILLTPNAPPLTINDKERGMFIVDATWRYAETMIKTLKIPLTQRSIPEEYKTAYPRRQEEKKGLASIEAIFVAYHILGYYTNGLLEDYYWKEEFLNLNPGLNREYC